MRSLLALFLVPAVFAAGCNVTPLEGSGTPATETRDVEGLNAVGLSLSGELRITQTGEESLTVTADDNILPFIETRVEDGRLNIRLSPDCTSRSLRPVTPIRYDLTVRDLSAVAVSGSGKVVADTLTSGSFAIAVSGSGDVVVGDLEVERVDVAISGSGNVAVSGSAPAQAVAISGSGGYDGGGLMSESASVAVSGSGDAQVWAEGSLEVVVSGSGSVGYYGSPVLDKRVSGSGAVRSLGDRRISL